MNWLFGPLSFLLQTAASSGSAVPQPTEVAPCLAALSSAATKAGIRRATFDAATRDFVVDSTVLAARANQPEFKIPIWDYMAALVDSERIADGAARLAEWDSVLRVVERTSGVDRHVIVAVWGVESDFGRGMGQRPLIRSLLTGSCLGSRQRFFREQLIATLKIVDRGDIPPDQLVGSWAGAFGQTQFMPTTFLTRAVDQDGDGKRDVINSIPDALGSTANYLAKAGWIKGGTWGYEVKLPRGYHGPSGRTRRQPLTRWSALGIKRRDGKAIHGTVPAALLLPAGPAGPAFLVFKNFDVIYAYNAAESYALAIAHLSDRLKGAKPVVAAWPTDDRGLSRAERREVQQRLQARGYEVGSTDGYLGAKSREAIKAYQAKIGLEPNGRAGGRVLDSLRASAPPNPSSR